MQCLKRYLNIMLIGMVMPLAVPAPGSGSGTGAAGVSGAAEFRQKIAALQSLQEKVVDRIDTALALRADLMAYGRKFEDEISDLQRRHRYDRYQEAARNPRVNYNLELIQMVSGYTGALDEKIDLLEEGLEQIRFVYCQAEDELGMLQTLGTLETGALLARIERLLTAYRIETEKELITSATVSHRPCDSIWQDIVDRSRWP